MRTTCIGVAIIYAAFIYSTEFSLATLLSRVGRTGRAGNKGTAITFIAEEEERYAPDLVKAIKDSGGAVPEDLLVSVILYWCPLKIITLCLDFPFHTTGPSQLLQ
jgi:hypothetical protein